MSASYSCAGRNMEDRKAVRTGRADDHMIMHESPTQPVALRKRPGSTKGGNNVNMLWLDSWSDLFHMKDMGLLVDLQKST